MGVALGFGLCLGVVLGLFCGLDLGIGFGLGPGVGPGLGPGLGSGLCPGIGPGPCLVLRRALSSGYIELTGFEFKELPNVIFAKKKKKFTHIPIILKYLQCQTGVN